MKHDVPQDPVERMRLAVRFAQIVRDGKSYTEVARVSKMSPQTVSKFVRMVDPDLAEKRALINHPKKGWSDALKADLKIDWEDGKSAREIGWKLGKSKGAIVGQRYRMNLRKRRTSVGRTQWADECHFIPAPREYNSDV